MTSDFTVHMDEYLPLREVVFEHTSPGNPERGG